MATARSSLTVIIDQQSQVEYTDTVATPGGTANTKRPGKSFLNRILKHINGGLSGAKRMSHAQVFANATQPCAAAGLITVASQAAGDTITLGSTTLTAVDGAPGNNQYQDDGGTDTLVATSLAACIMGSTTAAVSSVFEASNFTGAIALSSVPAGTNIYIAGNQFQAVTGASATALPTYANAIPAGVFTIVGSDTQDGDSLALAINTHPILSHKVYAKNSSGTVTIYQRRGTAALGKITTDSGSGVTITQFAAGTTVCVSPLVEGLFGNQLIALAISAHGSVVQWAGGAGNDATPARILINGAVT